MSMLDLLPVSCAHRILATQANLEIINSLTDKRFESRFVGGCVHDALLGIRSKDIDISSTATPDKVADILSSLENIKINLFAKRYGIVNAKYNGQMFQIATLRKDVKTYGRNVDIAYTKSWEEDSTRRDFTINAMYMDISGRLYDFHNGLNDLNEGRINFIGDPAIRVKEDYIRILRYFRFWGKFSRHNPENSVISVFSKNKDGLKNIPTETLKSEINKINKLNNAEQVFSFIDALEISNLFIQII